MVQHGESEGPDQEQSDEGLESNSPVKQPNSLAEAGVVPDKLYNNYTCDLPKQMVGKENSNSSN